MTKSEKQYQDMIDVYKETVERNRKLLKENKHDVLIPFYENNIKSCNDMVRKLMAKQIACRF